MGKCNRMKKFAAWLCAGVILAGALTGCGNSAAGETKNAESGKEASESKPESGGKEIELTFPCIWVGSDSKADVFGKMVEGFNTEYAGKYRVKIEDQTDYQLYRDKIRTMISTGTAPDIFTVDKMADLELFAESGKLMDLTEFLASDEMSGRFVKGVVEDSKIDGVNYAFPYENALVPLMFNEKLLKEAGIDKIPESFEALWDACDKLKANNIFPTTQMTKDPAWISMLWYSYALAACGGEDVFEKGLDDPAFVEAAYILQKLFENTSSDALGGDATLANGHFFNERAAIYTNGSWILGRIKSEGVDGLYDNLAVSPGLSADSKNGGAYINAVQAYLAAGKQDDPAKAEAVKAFFEYITKEDKITELTNSSGSIFAINVDASKVTDPIQAKIIEQSNQASFTIGYFQSEVSTPVMTAFPAALEGMVLGELTPEEFVQALKDAE